MSSPSEAIFTSKPCTRAGKSIVIKDLKLFGPSSSNPSMDLSQAEKYCKSLAQRHYENFSVASWLVPPAFRQDFLNIYAFCRWSDDLADEIGNSADSIRLLDWWRAELHACFSGTAKHPVFIALRETITKRSFSVENFEKLLDAFVHDQRVTRYDSHLEVFDYCRGSANPVGRILLQLACVEEPEALKLSDQICTGLQIANFCQDMRPDAQLGRIYLPRDVWQRFQLSESEILAGHATDNLRFALKGWVELARTQLVRGLPLVQLTPRWLARDIQLFARGGLALLNNIARVNYDVWSRPIEVSKRQKLALLLRSVFSPRSIQVADLACPNGSQLA